MAKAASIPPDKFYDISRNNSSLSCTRPARWFREFTYEARHILELLKFARCVIRRRVCTPTSAGAFQTLAATHKIYQRGTPEGERAFFFFRTSGTPLGLPCERDTRARTIYDVLYRDTYMLSSVVFLISDEAHFSLTPFP